jgi:hypothetical protein
VASWVVLSSVELVIFTPYRLQLFPPLRWSQHPILSIATIPGRFYALPRYTSVTTVQPRGNDPQKGNTSHQASIQGVYTRNLLGGFNSACARHKGIRVQSITVLLHFNAIICACATAVRASHMSHSRNRQFRAPFGALNQLICPPNKIRLSQAKRPPLWSSGQSSWLQIRRPGFDSRHYQKKM